MHIHYLSVHVLHIDTHVRLCSKQYIKGYKHKIIVCFWDKIKRVERERLLICFCYPHVPVSTNGIYSTLCLTSTLSYITTGKKDWGINGIKLIKKAL